MLLCLFEDQVVNHLAPLTLTRHTSDLRLAARTLGEMQQALFPEGKVAYLGREEISGVTRQEHPDALVNPLIPEGPLLLINARWVPGNGSFVSDLKRIVESKGEAIAFRQDDSLIAAWIPNPASMPHNNTIDEFIVSTPRQYVTGQRLISRLWGLLENIRSQLITDFETNGRRGTNGATIQQGVLIVGDDLLIEPGADIRPGAVINASNGPVWIGRDTIVEELAVITGPCYIGPGSRVKAGARVSDTAVGPVCKVGGEVQASVIHSYSNKSHDGYLGDSYIGQWCNIGADTNTSNLKNDYGLITVYDAVAKDFIPSGKQFLGLIMADHSKCAINTMFNTGTVVGVGCNLFGAAFPPRHVPSFAWGGADKFEIYRLEKALRVAEAVMARRNRPVTNADRELLSNIFADTRLQRTGFIS